MIPTEDNYVDWTLRGIHEYFQRIGYQVQTHSVGQRRERDWPFDRILAVGRKIFALQFKRPLYEHGPWRYKFTAHQHQLIEWMPWIFYCLPLFADSGLQNVALFHSAFAHAYAIDTDQGRTSGITYRWGAFATRLLACTEGLIIDSESDLKEFVRIMAEEPVDAYFTIDRATRELNIVHIERDRGEVSQ